MRFYKVTAFEDDPEAVYETTRAKGHDVLRGMKGRPSAAMELVEIETNQETIARILSGEKVKEKVLMTWMLTPRGGLKEIEP